MVPVEVRQQPIRGPERLRLVVEAEQLWRVVDRPAGTRAPRLRQQARPIEAQPQQRGSLPGPARAPDLVAVEADRRVTRTALQRAQRQRQVEGKRKGEGRGSVRQHRRTIPRGVPLRIIKTTDRRVAGLRETAA